jgi:hypothetical protein
MRRVAWLLLLAACDDLGEFSGAPATLASVTVIANDPTAGDLRVALVWGTQWLPEPLCFFPPSSPEVAAVIAAGCRDVFAFTPARASTSVSLVAGEPATLAVVQLPSADVMVGGLTARVAYASFVVFDDANGDGVLTLGRAPLLPAGEFHAGGGPDEEEEDDGGRIGDPIVGASFVSMTEPDSRLAFREGEFVETGFYPRHGCGVPPRGFSVLSASGFTYDAAIAATLAGELPAQDPAGCSERAPEDLVIDIAPRPVPEVACEQRRDDSSVQYRDPPVESPLDGHVYACTTIPTFDDDDPTAGITQLVVASNGPCKGLTHYTLVGCDDAGLDCDHYEWDLRANAPGWWPCE